MMKRMACVASVLALTLSLVLTLGPAGAQDKQPSIKEIMGRLHKGPDCLRAALARNLKVDAPAWSEVQSESKEFVKLAEALAKNTPPKGDQASWQQATGEFLQNARALDDAAQKKTKDAAVTAHAKLGNCTGCHRAHKT